MEQIDLGNAANDGSGSSLREAGEIINNNFTTLDETKATVEQAQAAANGVVWRETLAEVNAISPLVENTAYGVYNDGDNNGYYYWDGVSATVTFNRDLDVTIETSISNNLAKSEYLVYDKAILSNGQLSNQAGWVLLKIPIQTGVTYTFGNFEMTAPGYSSFMNENEQLVQYNGAHDSNNEPLPRSYSVASTSAKFLYIDIARPNTDPSLWANIMVNEGSELLPYEEPVDYIESINGYGFKPTEAESAVSLEVFNANKVKFTSRRKPTLSFIFDDLNPSDALVYSIFQDYGFLPSFALQSNQITSENSEFYIDKYTKGCSILAHSVTHPVMSNSANITSATVDDQMRLSKKAIEDLGIKVSGWVTPSSALDEDFFPLMEQHFGYGFTRLNNEVYNATVDPLKMHRFGVEGEILNGNGVQGVKDRIDIAIANNELLVLYAHELPSDYLDGSNNSIFSEVELREVLAYIKTKTDINLCEMLPTDEAVATYYRSPFI